MSEPDFSGFIIIEGIPTGDFREHDKDFWFYYCLEAYIPDEESDRFYRWLYDVEFHARVYRGAEIIGSLIAFQLVRPMGIEGINILKGDPAMDEELRQLLGLAETLLAVGVHQEPTSQMWKDDARPAINKIRKYMESH